MEGTIFVEFKLAPAPRDIKWVWLANVLEAFKAEPTQEQMWIWLATALDKLQKQNLLQQATIEALVRHDKKSPYRGSFAIDFTGDERCLKAIQAVRHVERAYFGKPHTPLSAIKATKTAVTA
jgi:hypothetical protein